ncbi:hypothetical protein MASR1M32_29040 [Rhodobacter sp.]
MSSTAKNAIEPVISAAAREFSDAGGVIMAVSGTRDRPRPYTGMTGRGTFLPGWICRLSATGPLSKAANGLAQIARPFTLVQISCGGWGALRPPAGDHRF